MVLAYLSSLIFLIWCLLFYSVGAGLLLHILRGYRSGSIGFRRIASISLWAFVLLFIAAAVLSSANR